MATRKWNPKAKKVSLKTSNEVGLKYGFRSGLEATIAKQLEENDIKVLFETEKIPYIKPEKPAKYTPDFKLPNGIYIETKGRFLSDDRQKHLLIKQQYPDLDIRFIFSRSKSTITTGSKTTYADWCIKHGFKYADKLIPIEWLKENK
jgi:hypothetical protein